MSILSEGATLTRFVSGTLCLGVLVISNPGCQGAGDGGERAGALPELGSSPAVSAEPALRLDPHPLASQASSGAIGASVMAEVQKNGRAQVLIALSLPAGDRVAARDRVERIASLQAQLLGRVSPQELSVHWRYSHLPALAGMVTAAGLAQLARAPEVAAIQLDLPMEAQLAESVPLVRADWVSRVLRGTGQNVRVAVLDTGVSWQHPQLADSIVAQQCFLSNSHCLPARTQQSDDATDEHWHGTSVTSIITGNGGDGYPRGIAPGASIVAIRVLDETCRGTFSDLVAALNWIVANQAMLQVQVVNMSLTGAGVAAGSCDDLMPVMTMAVGALADLGITVFAASGNGGRADGVSAPACLSRVIAVGATYDASFLRYPGTGTYADLASGFPACADSGTSAATVACFTNSSGKLDLLAPGTLVRTLGPVPGTFYNTFGTSGASPMAAGAAALMLEQNPTLSPKAVRDALRSTGVAVTDPRNGLVIPRIDAYAAVLAAQCLGRPDGAACNDGNACSQTDTCQGGRCVGASPVLCIARDQCHSAGTCNPDTGLCSNPNQPDGTACNDANACTTGDTCQAGSCRGTAISCNDGNLCTGDSCTPETGQCVYRPLPAGTACDDGNPRTKRDRCDGSGGCRGTLIAKSEPVSCGKSTRCE